MFYHSTPSLSPPCLRGRDSLRLQGTLVPGIAPTWPVIYGGALRGLKSAVMVRLQGTSVPEIAPGMARDIRGDLTRTKVRCNITNYYFSDLDGIDPGLGEKSLLLIFHFSTYWPRPNLALLFLTVTFFWDHLIRLSRLSR